MNKNFKGVLSFVLALTLILSTFICVGNVFVSATDLQYKTGDKVEFGSYPQSQVTDNSTIALLNLKTKKWISYGYYSGLNLSSGTMTAKDFMKYADITVNGQKYRAVKFSSYRPYWSYFDASNSYSYQDDNGFETNKAYYFKFEPVIWRILDASKGLLMSEMILDAQCFSNTVYSYSHNDKDAFESYNLPKEIAINYANDYASSSIRKWLNEDFYNTAFNDLEKSEIGAVTLSNKAYNTAFSKFDGNDTTDKVFLLSYSDLKNKSYGFDENPLANDTSRCAKGTDYAKSQGLWIHSSVADTTGYFYWRLRSPSYSAEDTAGISYDGSINNNCFNVASCSVGTRPAIKCYKFRNITNNSLNRVNGVWSYYKNGSVDTTFTGLANNEYGWYYVKNGTVDFSYNGLAKNKYGTWYVKNGTVDKSYTGMYKNVSNWVYIQNGKLNESFTGLAKNPYGWWYFKNGKIDYSYKGLCKNQYGWWYIQNGTINFKFNGTSKNQYGNWKVVNGKVTKKA